MKNNFLFMFFLLFLYKILIMNKQCVECPWKVKSRHNEKWEKYVNNLLKVGFLKEKKHNCHMKKNVWSDVSDDTVCIGSLNA
jgi:hypothetical protein